MLTILKSLDPIIPLSPKFPDDVIEMINERTAQMNLGPLFWTFQQLKVFEVNYTDVINNNEHLDNDSWHLDLPDSIVS
ncbi:MAG: hypothetical protein CM15mP102_03920 [Flavobacteriales bacterium]|nr:MAG: hypothetical protein CM15mP102_03920 [Flavobacteriales bacterium]